MVSQHGSNMPATDDGSDAKHVETSIPTHPSAAQNTSTTRASPFAIPQFIKRIFDAFPLRNFPANEPPARLQRLRNSREHVLFVWTTERDALAGRASFNPACFRWQLYLKSRGIPFRTLPSNNHASTIDRLPFLLVTDKNDDTFGNAEMLSAQDLSKHAANQLETWPKELDIHYDAYMSLLSNEIRIAWQHHLYLTQNFDRFVIPAYITSQTRSRLVQLMCAHELRTAARADIYKYLAVIDADDIYTKADAAFASLDSVLARKMRIQGGGFADREPSLLEATLYAYLFLLLETPVDRWADARLPRMVKRYPELLRMHRDISATFEFEAPSVFVGGK